VKLKWWQRLLCRWMCPRFHEDMPEDKGGMWVACSLKVSFCGRSERDTVEVEGLRNAYEVARWLALKLDWRLHPTLGVDWAVRELKQGNKALHDSHEN
jgi:hypothetical protein